MLGILIIVVLAVLLVAIAIIGYGIGIYNGFVQLRNNIQKSWANIDVLLKQRSDELPKLIASVKGYLKHEKTVLEELTKARTALLSAKTNDAKAKADLRGRGELPEPEGERELRAAPDAHQQHRERACGPP